MKKVLKSAVSLVLVMLMVFGAFATSNFIEVMNCFNAVAAESYPAISAIKIPRIAQTDHKSCNLCSQASVEAYIQGTYAGITFEYGVDYPMTTQLFLDMKSENGDSAGWSSTLNTKYGYTRSTTYSLSKIYNLLAEGKPVIIYVESATDNSSEHGSVIIGYNGSSTVLEESGFTVMEIHKDNGDNSKELFDKYANNPEPANDNESCYVSLSSWRTGAVKHIIYPNNVPNYKSGKCGDNVTYSFDKTTGAMVISGTGDMYGWGLDYWFNIPWSSYCEDIKTITIEEGVTSIGYTAFSPCINLESVSIANSVTTIDGYAFADCENLKSIEIPDSVTRIEAYAFCGCKSLNSIFIPKSVTYIGWEAFYECTSLSTVYYGGSEDDWNKVTIMEGNEPLQNATIYYNGSTATGSNGFMSLIAMWTTTLFSIILFPFIALIALVM